MKATDEEIIAFIKDSAKALTQELADISITDVEGRLKFLKQMKEMEAACREYIEYAGGITDESTMKHQQLLPSYAWPGGYPIIYLEDQSDMYCASCAAQKFNEEDSWVPRITYFVEEEGTAPGYECEGGCGNFIGYGAEVDEETGEVEYEYIRKWGHMMGSNQGFIERVVSQAQKEGAPSTAIYKKDDGTWATIADIESDITRNKIVGN